METSKTQPSSSKLGARWRADLQVLHEGLFRNPSEQASSGSIAHPHDDLHGCTMADPNVWTEDRVHALIHILDITRSELEFERIHHRSTARRYGASSDVEMTKAEAIEPEEHTGILTAKHRIDFLKVVCHNKNAFGFWFVINWIETRMAREGWPACRCFYMYPDDTTPGPPQTVDDGMTVCANKKRTRQRENRRRKRAEVRAAKNLSPYLGADEAKRDLRELAQLFGSNTRYGNPHDVLAENNSGSSIDGASTQAIPDEHVLRRTEGAETAMSGLNELQQSLSPQSRDTLRFLSETWNIDSINLSTT
jgi:hypothetical protein